jgi:hypothetical protein
MKTVCIRQPGYLPNIGFFQKLMFCDEFVYLDDTKYGSERWDNRNKIRSDKDFMFLTIPIVRKTKNMLNEILIANNENWQKKHLRSLSLHYSKAPYFDDYWFELKSILEKKWEKIIELNIELIDWIKLKLRIETKTVLSSKLEINETGNKKLLEICKKLNATRYLSGKMGKNYLDESIFVSNNIQVIYDNFDHPKYNQVHGNFLPNMSIIDLLFNEGEKSIKIINNSIN